MSLIIYTDDNGHTKQMIFNYPLPDGFGKYDFEQLKKAWDEYQAIHENSTVSKIHAYFKYCDHRDALPLGTSLKRSRQRFLCAENYS